MRRGRGQTATPPDRASGSTVRGEQNPAQTDENEARVLAKHGGKKEIVLRLAVPAMASARLGMGCIALLLLLVAGFGFMLRLRELTIREYFAS